MAKKRMKTKAAPIAIPRDQAEAEKLLADIGRLQRQVGRVEHDMNDALAAVKDKFEKAAQPLNEQIETKFQALHIWAEAHRDELLKGKAKTARLATGELQWRMTPPAVKIPRKITEAVIANLKTLGLGDLVRTKEEINKEAILADPKRVDGVRGITIEQHEEFVAKPFESEIEKVEPVKKAAAK